MSMVQPLFQLLDINLDQFIKNELIFLEAELYTRICREIMEIIKEQNKDYFQIMKFNKEQIMLETKFIRCIINDILSSEEYNLSGIALYADTPEDVIFDLASGYNANPTFLVSRKIIELHRMVRPNLYLEIADKIKRELLNIL